MISGLLVGCSNNNDTTSNQPGQAVNSTQIDGDNTDNIDGNDTLGAELNHTYTTQWGVVNGVTYPKFYFDYPDGWTITSEEVTSISEEVVLTKDTGVTVTFWNFKGMRDLTGPTRDINCVDITWVANADFVPSSIQGTDYSDLGAFIVAKIKTTGKYDVLNGGEYSAVENGSVRYALMPESEIDQDEECIIPGLPTFSFWYAGHISLIARTPNGEFTEQEEQEVVAILSSFRDRLDSSEYIAESVPPTETNTVTTMDELWEMLDGTWTLEEFWYMGKLTSDSGTSIEFLTVDGEYCIRRFNKDRTAYQDDPLYDFTAVDESHYNIYRYKRNSYGGEFGNFSDDVQLVWYDLDLSNLSSGELTIERNLSRDNGFVDSGTYKYRRS